MFINTKTDLCICSCWDLDVDGFRHGISGHIFEIIEYFYILKNKYETKILIGDPRMTRDIIEDVLLYKYNFNDHDINELLDSIIYCESPPSHVIGKTALFVDGCLVKMQQSGVKLYFDKIYTFKCSKYEEIYNLQAYNNVVPLLDYRVYKDVNQRDVDIGVNYKKKILINKLRAANKTITNTALLYLTGTCRKRSVDYVLGVIEKYNFNKYLIVTDTDIYNSIRSHTVKVLKPPVRDLFSLFDTYIYTPIESIWDGSPRFPVECAVLGKTVIYHDIDDDYLSIDRGLYYRRRDIDTAFESLSLTNQDEILNIL